MSAIESTGSAADIRSDYMNLLITQLKNQNPFDPVDNNQMAGQLTQLSQLEQLENMNSVFKGLLSAEQNSQAYGLIGKVIAFFPEGSLNAIAGKVEGVELIGGKAHMVIGDNRVSVEAIQAITEMDTAATT